MLDSVHIMHHEAARRLLLRGTKRQVILAVSKQVSGRRLPVQVRPGYLQMYVDRNRIQTQLPWNAASSAPTDAHTRTTWQ
jgi:hypothetical protein